jgi:curved DNA-binding protein CbpA
VLGVARDATTEEIRRAYLARARQHHPDTGGADDRRMRDVNAAWHVLRDPARRRAHDRELGVAERPGRDDDPVSPEERSVPLVDQVDGAVGPPRPGDLLVLVPAALLAAAVGCFAVATVMLHPGLFAAAVALFVLSGVTFVVAPFATLARDRRRRRRYTR